MRVQSLIRTRKEAHSHGYAIGTDVDQQRGLAVFGALGRHYGAGQACWLQSARLSLQLRPRRAASVCLLHRLNDARFLLVVS